MMLTSTWRTSLLQVGQGIDFPPMCKSGMLLNNCCESFNGVLREARAKPILTMMEWIRRWVNARFCPKKKEGLHKLEGKIMSSVVKFVEKQRQ